MGSLNLLGGPQIHVDLGTGDPHIYGVPKSIWHWYIFVNKICPMMVLTLFLRHHQVYIHLVQQKLTFLNLDIFMRYIASYSLRLLQSNLWQGFNFAQPCVNFVAHKRFRILIFSWGSHLHIASYACRMSLGMRLTYALPVEGLATRIKRDSMFIFWCWSRNQGGLQTQQCYEALLPFCLLNHCKSRNHRTMKHISRILIRATNTSTGDV